jgi:hypothetical protein
VSEPSPGPWTALRNAIMTAEQFIIAVMVPERVHGASEADARLIAAAPELLAMLKRQLTPGWNDAEDARALIARIEGR